MNNEVLIKALQYCGSTIGDCGLCFYKNHPMCYFQMVIDAAAALKAADKRIAELSLDCEMYQLKCMELEAQLPKEGEWITADNPPKNEGLYLVGLSVGWDNEYVVRLARYTKDLSEALFSSKLRGDGWYRWDGDNDSDVICHPQYWMELPKPPNRGAKMQTVTDCHALEER